MIAEELYFEASDVLEANFEYEGRYSRTDQSVLCLIQCVIVS